MEKINQDVALFADGVYLQPIRSESGKWFWCVIDESTDCSIFLNGKEILSRLAVGADSLNKMLEPFYPTNSQMDEAYEFIQALPSDVITLLVHYMNKKGQTHWFKTHETGSINFDAFIMALESPTL